MSGRKAVYCPASRLMVGSTSARAPVAVGGTAGADKKSGSTTLLSSDSSHPYLTLKDIPGPRPSIPFIGTGWQYFPGGRYSLANLHEAGVDKFRRYGPIVKEEFQWRKPVVHLFDPDHFQTVFRYQGMQPVRPVSEFLKHYRMNNPEKYDTVGLANSVGDEWQRLRRVLGPVLLLMSSLEGLIGEINNINEDFVTLLKSVRNPHTFCIDNLQDYVYRLSLEGVYMMSLETRLGCLDLNLHPSTPAFAMIASVKLLFEAFQELFYGLPLWKFMQTSSYKKLDKAESIMYDATSRRIQEAIEKLRQSNLKDETRKASVLQTLIETPNLTDKEIRVTVIDFLSGGIFTITNAFSFLVYHLARNQDVQEKLYQELMQVVPDGVITAKLLQKLPYLRACIKESFRLSPTIPTITRILPSDISLSGYHIPAGVPIFCNFTVPCMREDMFPEPHRFLPDRWLEKTGSSKAYTLLPFGFGPRMCVGRRFAETEMYTALAKLVYHFRLESTGQEVKCKQAFIVVPSHPISVILRDR